MNYAVAYLHASVQAAHCTCAGRRSRRSTDAVAAAAVLAVMAGIRLQWAASMNETDGARCDGL